MLSGKNVLKADFLAADNVLSYIHTKSSHAIDLAAGVEYSVTFHRVQDAQYTRIGLMAGNTFSASLSYYYIDVGGTRFSISKYDGSASNKVQRLYATEPVIDNPLDGFTTYTIQLQEGVNSESTAGLWIRVFQGEILAAEWFDENPHDFNFEGNDVTVPFIGFRSSSIAGTNAYISEVTLTQIPEPSTVLLLGLGTSALAFRKRFRMVR